MTDPMVQAKSTIFEVFASVVNWVLSESQMQQSTDTSRSYHCANSQTVHTINHWHPEPVFLRSSRQTQLMTFEQALIASGYYYQPECGAYWKEDKNQNVHSYLELENGEWSYVKYDENEVIRTTKVFALN